MFRLLRRLQRFPPLYPSFGSQQRRPYCPALCAYLDFGVREGASVRTRTIFTLLRNVHVTGLGLSTNRHWLKIQTEDGKVGWVSAAYIKLVGGRFRNLPTVQ